MKNLIMRICLSLLLFGLNSTNLFGQPRYDRQGTVHAQLMNLIHEKFGGDFRYVGYSILDSLISHSLVENDRIRDPYNTLRACILFSTYKDNGKYEPDTFIAGMVKNGKIIWDNAPGTHADLGGDLRYAQDINHDGEVDLLVREVDREFVGMQGPGVYYLYILSWNGTEGRLINTFIDDGKSALIGNGGFELAGRKKNSIRNIITKLPDIEADWYEYKTSTFPVVTYTWNGKQYGLWVNTTMTKPAQIRPFMRQEK